MTSIGIVDYGVSNLRSVQQAFAAVAPAGVQVRTVTDAAGIRDSDKVVFPGQGAAEDCMRALAQHQMADAVLEAVREKPFLGICMGLQMLLGHSDENGGTPCLGVFSGAVRHLAEHRPPAPNHKIPHMGWNQIMQVKQHPLWHGIDDAAYFYFVHSYYAVPTDLNIVAGVTDYGEQFACAIANQFVFAVQFHPEKSADNGLRLLKNFLQWNGKN